MAEKDSDITEQKKAWQELSFKSLLLDSATDSIFIMDLDGNMLYVNETAYRDRGYTKDELMAMPLYKLDTPEYTALFKPRLEALIEKGGSAVFESAHFKKDGTVMPVEVHARIIEYRGRKVIVSSVRDITARKKVEEELQASENKLRNITSVLGEGVYVLDRDGRLTFINPEAERLLGWTEAELIGKDVHKTIHYQRADRTRVPIEECPVHRVLKFDNIYRTEEDVFTRKDGSMFSVAYVCTPIMENGKIVAAVTVFQDITERKRAKELSDALNTINNTINSTLDFEEIMKRVVIDAARGMGTEAALLVLREENHWRVGYSYGFPSEVVGVELTDDQAKHIVLSVQSKRPVVINDALRDKRVNRQVMEKYGIRSVLTIPLLVKGKAIGALGFCYHTAPIAFTDTQVDFANKLGTSVSLGLENARLYEAQRHIADTLQEALLIVPEHIEGVEYGHLYQSAAEEARVGGDFYDIFEIEPSKVGIVVGDVAGHGVEAAALTSIVKNTIKAHALEDRTPAITMAKTNDLVAKTSPPGSFVTVFFGILEIETGKLTYCSAGHPPAVIKRKPGEIDLLIKHSPILGAFKGLHYRSGKANLNKGDILIAYTDGITEARFNGDFYGEQRLVDFIENLAPIPVKDIPQAILNNVMEYTGGKLSDDVALLAANLQGYEDA